MPTGITWCDETWNPISGCTPISEGCANCYAAAMAKRLQAMGRKGYENGFEVAAHWEKRIQDPLHWRRPRLIFVCSMGDLFHERVPDEWIDSVFGIMAACHRHEWLGGHTFLILTKRPERMRRYLSARDLLERWAHDGAQEIEDGDGVYDAILTDSLPLSNVWLGVTVENQARADERIPILLQTPAAHRFISVEPMLGPVDIEMFVGSASRLCPACGLKWGHDHSVGGTGCNGIEWVICGGESGPGYREMDPVWAKNLRWQCKFNGVPFHLKQFSGFRPEKCPELDGVRHTARPPFEEGA